MKEFIREDVESTDRKLYVHFEFVYFFMHLTNRAAFRLLGQEQRIKLQDELGPPMVHGTIEGYFAHWPSEMKQRMKHEFFKKLNDTEVQYSACKGLFSADEPFTSNTLCTQVARNVAQLAGDSENPNPATIMMAMHVAITAFETIKLDELIGRVAKVL